MEYKLKDNKLLENGHTMFKSDVLQRLNRLVYLEKKNKELLEVCEEALKHHQGGHSEIGHKLRDAIKR